MHGKSPFMTCVRGLIAIACTVAIALALGAIWMALSLHLASARWWFALPAGASMGYAARAWVTRQRAWRTLLAMAGTLLMAIYMQCLAVGLLLANVLGLELIYTLRTAGVTMLLALARDSLAPRFIIATLIGIALAGWVAWRERAHANITA